MVRHYKGKLKETLTWNPEFEINMKIQAYEDPLTWSNIFQFTNGNNSAAMGERNPMAWIQSGPKLAIFQNMGSMDETYIDIEIDRTHDVVIRQTKHVDKYVYEVRVDDVIYKSKVNPQPQTFSDMKLYLSSPFVVLTFNGSLSTVINV